ncbi:family 43 glycosylhydrolase [Pontibacter sp. G13]|uniref:glycoside hydrolase family 43 protein n=1 Tax=Pontibacter sp. G13 TaxID=3074898 RepID=UPI0028892BB9|nr:family 43 glycosylhydrolase [Pontibacter sp. G13]WNJ19136.1 family 43 glycosylhydrolase [Pontibacter sp. G13]
MNRLVWAGMLGLGLLSGCHMQSPRDNILRFEYQNPISAGIDPNGLRDCQVIRDGDWWYLTGTSFPHWSRQETDSLLNPGVALYRSKDLLHWEFRSYIIERPEIDKWYYRRFWAPEIQQIGGKYYALFNCRNDSLGYVGQHTGYAVADQIEGPYQVVTEEAPLCTGNDLTFFEDKDGKVWAFWNRGREFGIGFAQIDLTSGEFLTEPTTAILAAPVDYEYDETGEIVMTPGYDGRPKKKVATYHGWDAIGIEGAYVIERSGTYYLFYSSWTRGYEIGYATAPAITGPWTKYAGNPFYGAMSPTAFEKNGIAYEGAPDNPYHAVGHNEIFEGPDGRLWLSCHGILPDQPPMLVIDPLSFDEEGQVFSDGPSHTLQTITW